MTSLEQKCYSRCTFQVYSFLLVCTPTSITETLLVKDPRQYLKSICKYEVLVIAVLFDSNRITEKTDEVCSMEFLRPRFIIQPALTGV